MKKIIEKTEEGVKVGDIFYDSWGYEQTNIDFYEVIQVNGLHTVTICAIGAKREYTHSMAGECTPIPSAFVRGGREEALRKRVKMCGSRPLLASPRGGYLNIVEAGKKYYFSEYA